MINYKDMLIIPRKHCVDVCNPANNQWFVVPSVRSAKWHISILCRLRSILHHAYPKDRDERNIL